MQVRQALLGPDGDGAGSMVKVAVLAVPQLATTSSLGCIRSI